MRLNFANGSPGPYQESNNKSFQKNPEFGLKEIQKLIDSKDVVEVCREEVMCVNPLSVASNKEGKLQLCIDLSRCVNNHCQAKKFRIESVPDLMKTVNKGDWLYSFDLKSAFHHVNIHESHQKYLGFEAVLGGRKRWFKFKAMPFGYCDASRVITKVLRVPVHH